MRTIRDDKLWDNSATIGAFMLDELNAMQERYPFIGNVRGAGLFLGLDIVRNRRTKEPVPASVMRGVFESAVRRGLLAMLYTSRVRLQPALTISREAAAEALGLLDETFAELDRSGRWQ